MGDKPVKQEDRQALRVRFEVDPEKVCACAKVPYTIAHSKKTVVVPDATALAAVAMFFDIILPPFTVAFDFGGWRWEAQNKQP